jgi:hypothetical protein
MKTQKIALKKLDCSEFDITADVAKWHNCRKLDDDENILSLKFPNWTKFSGSAILFVK